MVRNTLGKDFFDVTLPYPFTSLFKQRCIGYNNIKVALVYEQQIHSMVTTDYVWQNQAKRESSIDGHIEL